MNGGEHHQTRDEWGSAAGDFERLAYDAALRGLDKQERVLEELRARTGLLLAASSLAASFLGQQAFRDAGSAMLTTSALIAFVGTIFASVYVLTPKKTLIFAQSGSGLYEGLYEVRDDLAEVFRRLAYDLDRFWESNDKIIARLLNAYRFAALGLVAEILLLVALVSGNLS